MAAQKNGSEQQLEFVNDVFFLHTLSSTFMSGALEEHDERRQKYYQSAVCLPMTEEKQELEALAGSLDKLHQV